MKLQDIRTPMGFGLAFLLLVLPFLCNAYWLDVCVSIGLYALLALSLNVILGQAGIFHMGHAAFFAVGAYTTSILNTLYHWPVLWTMPLAGCAAAFFALAVARPIIHLRGDYLLIVTIGFWISYFQGNPVLLPGLVYGRCESAFVSLPVAFPFRSRFELY